MVYSGMIGQTSYDYYIKEGMPGTLEGMGEPIVMPYMNAASGAQKVMTITPPGTVDANTAYKLTFDGAIVVSVTTGGSTTDVQLGALLYNAIRAEGQVYRLWDVSLAAGTGVLTLTHRFVNVDGTITANSADTTNDLTIATTTAIGTSTRIPFGRFVGRKAAWTVETNGLSSAALINHASDYTQILGVTMKQVLEKDAIGPTAKASYPFGATMNVCESTGTHKGIWVESVEADIDMRSHSCYIAVGSGNEGKVTRTSSSNVDISAKAKFVSNSVVGPGGVRLALVRFDRFW